MRSRCVAALAVAIITLEVNVKMKWLFVGKRKYIVFVLFLIVLGLLGQLNSTTPHSSESPTASILSEKSISPTFQVLVSSQQKITPTITSQTISTSKDLVAARVVRVVDGDTIVVDLGDGKEQKLRYIGMDAPETSDPSKPVQCFGHEAAERNKELVEGKLVELEKDISETDKYGRLLRYVYVGSTLINQQLVSEGYARATSYPPDVKYQAVFTQSEQQARSANKGLWGGCGIYTLVPTVRSGQTSTTQTTANATTTGACKYSCSGPDRDCSDFTSHQEAQTFFNCCGFTATNDPMNLDGTGVGDGVACESLP